MSKTTQNADKMSWVEPPRETNKDLIGKPPSAIVRYGSALILAVLVILITLSYFIQVPETVTTDAVIRPDKFPVTLTSPGSGPVNVFVKEGQSVRSGEALFMVNGLQVLSPCSGKVVILATGLPVGKYDTIMALLDSDPATSFAYLRVPAENAGKIKRGQQVRFSLPVFPARPYGTLRGFVENISALPVAGKYEVRVSLPRGLTTDNQYPIRSFLYLTGSATIIIKNRSLLARIFKKSF